MDKAKNSLIELLRFIFMLIIALWHYEKCNGLMLRGYIAVEFFFILSGVLLYSSCRRYPDQSSIAFTKRRISKFWPEYCFSLILCYAIHVLSLYHNEINIVAPDVIKSFLSEILFLQGFSFAPYAVNYPCWYLSVLLISGCALYAFIRIGDKMLTVLPLFVIAGYVFIYSKGNTIEQWHPWFLPFIRGGCDMSLGVIVGYMSKTLKCHKIKSRALFYSIVAIMLLLVLLLIVTPHMCEIAVIILLSCMLLLCISNDNDASAPLERISIVLGSVTYEMLIFQVPIMFVTKYICSTLSLPGIVSLVAYVPLLVIFSFAVKRIMRRMCLIRWK